ncbi:hypothetical protein [[Roseibacterium] beibuensis]|uniref:hypothetical protein n=1 Tax=[Roseibacterium] beibuensis TaxID=1193142 RepID=UPI0031E924E9
MPELKGLGREILGAYCLRIGVKILKERYCFRSGNSHQYGHLGIFIGVRNGQTGDFLPFRIGDKAL